MMNVNNYANRIKAPSHKLFKWLGASILSVPILGEKSTIKFINKGQFIFCYSIKSATEICIKWPESNGGTENGKT